MYTDRGQFTQETGDVTSVRNLSFIKYESLMREESLETDKALK